MATSHGYPRWLLDCKQNIGDSKEWNAFLRELHDAIQQQLTESHVQYFTDLSEPEKDLFMQRATKAIEGGTASSSLYKKVSLLLDQGLNEEVSRQLLEDSPADTKSDLIIESAEEGAISLLKKWPDMKYKLQICLNQPLTVSIRHLTWKLYLTNTKARKQYVDTLNSNPRACISTYDYDISQKCDQLLNSEPTFVDLKGSTGAFYGLKAILSYYHAIQMTKARLPDVDHLLGIPILMVATPNLSRRDPPSSSVMALLVEEFITFMDSRPGFVVDSGSESHEEEMRGFVDKVAKLLKEKYPDTVPPITEKFAPSKEKIVATETGTRALLVDGLTTLVRPLVRGMFVGYMRMDTLLYIWDQYILGLDTPGFGTEWLAIITVSTLGLLSEKLKEAQTVTAMEQVLLTESTKLTVPQFQYEVKRHYYRDLLSMLQQDQKAAMPVLDPTRAAHPPWRHWYNDVIPPYTTPQDRRKAREEREAERERVQQQQKDAEKARRDQEEKTRRDEEGALLKMTALEKQRSERERQELEDMLEEERQKRMEEEDRAREEIEKLHLEIEVLKNQTKRSPAHSSISVTPYVSRVLIAPPPSRVSRPPTSPHTVVQPLTPVQEILEPPTPPVHKSPRENADAAVLDFLKKIKHSFNKVAHAEGAEKRELDRETDKYVEENIEDIKKAQMEVFGYKLQSGEFDRMSPGKQQEASDKMLELIQKWREERRAQELRRKSAADF